MAQHEEEQVDQYITYEDYLDAQITAQDRRYLEDDELARQLVPDSTGYRSGGIRV